jgi:transposase InsO family protein
MSSRWSELESTRFNLDTYRFEADAVDETLLTAIDASNADLEKKLAVWERFYNFDRPHGAHGGKTPYEALREKLS